MNADATTNFWAFMATLAYIVHLVLQRYYARRVEQARKEASGRLEAVKESVKHNSDVLHHRLGRQEQGDVRRDKKLEGIDQTVQVVHLLVNNRLSIVLRELARVRRQLASLTGKPDDVAEAAAAEERADQQAHRQASADELLEEAPTRVIDRGASPAP